MVLPGSMNDLPYSPQPEDAPEDARNRLIDDSVLKLTLRKEQVYESSLLQRN